VKPEYLLVFPEEKSQINHITNDLKVLNPSTTMSTAKPLNAGPSLAFQMLTQEEAEVYHKAVKDNESCNHPTTIGRPTPIPLRTLTVLLNYERCVSNPRFQNAGLFSSTFADPGLQLRAPWTEQLLRDKPSSVQEVHFHMFKPTANSLTETPSATENISPAAPKNVKDLPRKDLESIYYEIRGHDGCFKAVGLYDAFFDLCPNDQQVSIQIKKEAPVLLNPFAHVMLKYKMTGPKLITIIYGVKGENRNNIL
jgi:hypothetical protein